MSMRTDIPEETYHSDSAWSLHDLLMLRAKGPRYAQEKKYRDAFPYERKRCFDLGTACHMFLLEGGERTLDERCALRPETYETRLKLTKKLAKELGMPMDVEAGHLCKFEGDRIAQFGEDGFYYETVSKPWSGNAGECKAWVEAQGDRTIITKQERAQVIAMGHRALLNPELAKWLRHGITEVSIRHKAGEAAAFSVRSRLDWLATDASGNPVAILDYKTVASLGRFVRQISDFGYHRQAAFYRWMVWVETGEWLPFLWAVQETGGMNRCRIYQPSDEYLRLGQDQNEKDMELVESLMANVDADWPMDIETGVIPVEPPAWAQAAGWGDDDVADEEGDFL